MVWMYCSLCIIVLINMFDLVWFKNKIHHRTAVYNNFLSCNCFAAAFRAVIRILSRKHSDRSQASFAWFLHVRIKFLLIIIMFDFFFQWMWLISCELEPLYITKKSKLKSKEMIIDYCIYLTKILATIKSVQLSDKYSNVFSF